MNKTVEFALFKIDPNEIWDKSVEQGLKKLDFDIKVLPEELYVMKDPDTGEIIDHDPITVHFPLYDLKSNNPFVKFMNEKCRPLSDKLKEDTYFILNFYQIIEDERYDFVSPDSQRRFCDGFRKMIQTYGIKVNIY